MSKLFSRFLYTITKWIRPLLKKVIPRESLSFLKSFLPAKWFRIILQKAVSREWQRVRQQRPWHTVSMEMDRGVNVIGYFRTVKGISEAARSSALALNAVEIPYTVIDYEFGIPASQQVETLPSSNHGNVFNFNTNLFHVNPPQFPDLWKHFKEDELTGRYNIGTWYWELPEFPDEWRFAFDLVNEVWVASQFVFDSVSAKSPVPVAKIPPCISTTFDESLRRYDYNLPDDCFLFMCAYDVLSVQARKNPLGAIEAFKRAFKANDSAAGLVIKVNNAAENPPEIEKLRRQLKEYSNCFIIEDVFDRPTFNSLINLIDAYISLHRSEGFGLIPAEAMSLGKPVIMTRWSGNLDFMTDDNSCGVDYQLVPVGKGAGPYVPGQFWANPDLDQAAYFMQKLYVDKKFYAQISNNAKKTIRDKFSPSHIGKLMKDRMKQVGLLSENQ